MTTEQKPNESKTVLVIDKDKNIQETVKIFLEGHGVQVTATANGLDALNHFHNSSFHLILTSINVPVVSGNLIAIYVKDHTPDIPIIAMSQSGWMAEDYFDTVVEKPLAVGGYLMSSPGASFRSTLTSLSPQDLANCSSRLVVNKE